MALDFWNLLISSMLFWLCCFILYRRYSFILPIFLFILFCLVGPLVDWRALTKLAVWGQNCLSFFFIRSN